LLDKPDGGGGNNAAARRQEGQAMNDKQIRVAVHQKLFRHYSATPEP
jgi:hypothetical protein